MRKTWYEKSGVIKLRGAGPHQRIVYSLKSAPGKKINAMFVRHNTYYMALGYSYKEPDFTLCNLDKYGLKIRVTIQERDIYKVDFVNYFPFEEMDFDVGI
jgi:hypothetical protein